MICCDWTCSTGYCAGCSNSIILACWGHCVTFCTSQKKGDNSDAYGIPYICSASGFYLYKCNYKFLMSIGIKGALNLKLIKPPLLTLPSNYFLNDHSSKLFHMQIYQDKQEKQISASQGWNE